ncbi:hypothetical protein TNCV_3381511 [Trichonephila clavipes]|nr:hypothetical protein TNCV_3381511 [Trichonephila clavipes]
MQTKYTLSHYIPKAGYTEAKMSDLNNGTQGKIQFHPESDIDPRSSQNMILLKCRGRSTTRPSSFLIDRSTKVCTRPSDSLASYWSGPNNHSLWSFLNAPAPDGSSAHLDTLSTTQPLFL